MWSDSFWIFWNLLSRTLGTGSLSVLASLTRPQKHPWRPSKQNKRFWGDPKTGNGGMAEWRNGGKSPQILKRRMAQNHP